MTFLYSAIILNLFLMPSLANISLLEPDIVNNSILAEAVVRILETLVSETTMNLVTQENLNKLESYEMRAFQTELLSRAFSSGIVFRQESPSKIVQLKTRQRRCSVMLIKDFTGFSEVYEKLKQKMFKNNGYFIIVRVVREILDTQEIFKLLWKIQVYQVCVISREENNSISITTFMPFNTHSCSDTKPMLINQFVDGKFQKSLENIFFDKMKNLFNCPIQIGISNNSEPHIFVKRVSNKTPQLSGIDYNLIDTLSKTLKFKSNFSFISKFGYFYDNGTSEGPLKALLDGQVDLSVAGLWLRNSLMKFFDASTSYAWESIIFIIPPGRAPTTFEKLILPFTTTLWFLIFTCFLLGSMIIAIIKCRSKIEQNFVFGSRVHNPALNMFIAFVGGVQNVLPKRNFARFLLMMFLMYSLVIRTLYQGTFYKFMQSNKNFKGIQSIDEMVKMDFKFYVASGTAEVFEGTEAIRSRLNIKNIKKSLIVI